MQVEYELIKKVYPKSIIDKYLKLNKYLGSNDDSVVINFLLIKLFISVIIFFISFVFVRSLIISIFSTIIFNFLYNYIKFYSKLSKANKQEEKEASIFFEVLLISLKSGKNLRDAFLITTKNIDSNFSNKISNTLDNTKYGKSLIEALDKFKEEVYSVDVINIIDSIIESYTSGSDMVSLIEKSLELLDEKRINDIKMNINKLPIKVSIISVLLLIPLMLLIIFSPVIIEHFG